MKFDAIVIGGGAAGLFCAAEAGKRGRRVLVIERNAEAGRKIIISGGGRCNFTNLDVSAQNFVSRNPHFAKSALARYTPDDFVGLVKAHNIEFYEKKLGQLFCRKSSRQIVEMLLAECRTSKVRLISGCSVEGITRDGDGPFIVSTSQGSFVSESLVIASGGLSFPKVGATDIGYRVARQFGIEIVETRPSLVPLVLSGKAYRELAGVSIDARVSVDGESFRENILFTHRGLSGPAILQASNYWHRETAVTIDLLPDGNAHDLFVRNRGSRRRLDNLLAEYIPAKAAERLFNPDGRSRPLNTLNDAEIAAAAEQLNGWKVHFRDTEGYDKAEVTLGGVSTDELSSKTMGSKKVEGLYFIGEVVDVTGWLGGYNFQWAWSSAFAAAQAI